VLCIHQAKTLLHVDGVTRLQQVLISLAVGDKPKAVGEIKATAAQAGLRIPESWNVSDLLRKSGGWAILVPDGWELTVDGRHSLNALLGRTSEQICKVCDPVDDFRTSTPRRAAQAFDVAVVCALHKPELRAVVAAFGGESRWSPGPDYGQTHIYRTTSMVTAKGNTISLVAGAPTHMGLTATAVIATQMLFLFQPRLIVMVGVAAGTKATGRGYGDILIANPSVDYASGKISVEDGVEEFHPGAFPLPVDARIHTLVQEDMHTRDGLDAIGARWTGPRPNSPINVHIGPLGAADQVVNSERVVAAIKKNWRKLIGVEMETYALYRAAYEAPKPKPLYASFKAVCDFAEQKDDTWQEYAAYTAASYFRQFVERNWERLGV